MKKNILIFSLVVLLLVSAVYAAEGKLVKNIAKNKMGAYNYQDNHPVYSGVNMENYALFQYNSQNYIIFLLEPTQGGEYYLIGSCGKKACSIKSDKYFHNVKNSYTDINTLKKNNYKMKAGDGTCFYVQANALGIPIYDCKTQIELIDTKTTSKELKCGFDGWEEGKTYQLTKNLELSKKDQINSFCLNPNKDHVTIDCQGYKIINKKKINGQRGISFKDRSDITVKNCKIQGFDFGIVSDNSDYVNLTNNIAVNNKYQDYFCKETTKGDHFGTGNTFKKVQSCGTWPVTGKDYGAEEIVKLDSCKPAGGWKTGRTYKLTKDLKAADMVGGTAGGLPNWVCFNPTADNIVIDCNNHKLTGKVISKLYQKSQVKTYGAYLDWRKDIGVKNCKISGFLVGIGSHASSGVLQNNIVSNNKQKGISLEGADNKLKIDGNTALNNNFDFDCGTSKDTKGVGNKFKKVKQCPGGWPSTPFSYEEEVDWTVIQKTLGVEMTEMKELKLPGFAQVLFGNEKINIYIILDNQKKISFGAVTENGKLKGLSQKALSKPTLNVYATEAVIKEIQSSKDPLIALQKALDEGKITYKAVTVGNKVKLGLAKIFFKIKSWFS